MTPPFQRYPLVLRIFLMFSMFVFNISIVSGVALLAAKSIFNIDNASEVSGGTLNGANDINAFLFIQGISSLGGFVLTAIMFAVLESG